MFKWKLPVFDNTEFSPLKPFNRLPLPSTRLRVSEFSTTLHYFGSLDSFPYFHVMLIHWAATHFGRPCSSVRESGRVCLGVGVNRSRPPNMGIGKPAFVSRMQRPTLLGLRATVCLCSHLLRWGTVYRLVTRAPLFRGMLMGPKAIWICRACLGSDPAPGLHIKKKFVLHFSMVGC